MYVGFTGFRVTKGFGGFLVVVVIGGVSFSSSVVSVFGTSVTALLSPDTVWNVDSLTGISVTGFVA